MLYVLVAAVDLVDMVDLARSFGTHGSNQHGYTGTYIRACHVVVLELARVIVPDNHRPVRVAEDDLRAHVNQFVHEEQSALKHLLMDKHRSPCLCSYHKYDGQQVRCQSRPGRIGYGEDRAVEERLDLIMLLCRYNYIVAIHLDNYTEPAERVRDDSQVAVADLAYTQFRAGDSRHSDERAYLDHIRQQAVLRAVQFAYALDSQQVTAYSADTRTHVVQHAA